MPIFRSLILCVTGAAALLAQQGSLGGPVSGYIFDASGQSLRSIRGILGASLVGDPVDFGAPIASAWVAPKLDTTLVLTADGAPHIYRLDGGQAAERHADGLVAPERALFSPSGTALAIVTPGSVRIYKGLPDAPVVTGTVELPAETVVAAAGSARGKLGRPAVGPVAVSDDGLYLLYGSGTAVEILGVAGDSRKLTDASVGAVPVFAPGGHDAAVIDARTLALFSDVSGTATVRRLPGIVGVRSAGFSADGKRLFAAGAGAAVTSLDVASGDRVEIACDCRPTGLVRMGTAFRLTDFGTGPLWLLEDSANPRIVFVPAVR